jgi:type I restriction enzyme S subunit
MLWRQAYGATRPAIDYPGVKSLLIRVPDPSVQKVVGDAVRLGVLTRGCAMELISAAKVLVEALIEGKVSEAELQAAHDDREADREMLRSLTVKGLDVAGAPQLFADLNGLYQAIEETRHAGSSNGDAT